MPISPHQINNVLRVYGDQLRQSRISDHPEGSDADEPERIVISAKTRRETIIDGITSNIIKRITQSEREHEIETEVVKHFENENESPPPNHENRRSKLIFKKIDEHAETMNSLTIEDSKFLTHRLRIITKIR